MAKQKNAALTFMTGSNMSKYKEQFSEYFFLKDLMLEAARQSTPVVVSRSDFDAFGFDLLLSKQNSAGEWKSIRVQLKSTFKHKSWDVHKALLQDPDGRVIIIELSAQGESISPTYYSFNDHARPIALARSPKVAHESKCAVKLAGNEFSRINDNLLTIFN
jgi:hypothetical protein